MLTIEAVHFSSSEMRNNTPMETHIGQKHGNYLNPKYSNDWTRNSTEANKAVSTVRHFSDFKDSVIKLSGQKATL